MKNHEYMNLYKLYVLVYMIVGKIQDLNLYFLSLE